MLKPETLIPFVKMTNHLEITDSYDTEGYEPLELVLLSAYAQATSGKGAERHAAGDPFEDQPIIVIGQLLKSVDGEAYQVVKKLREGIRMHKSGNSGAALKEMFGVINYAASVALLISEEAVIRDGQAPDITTAPPKLSAEEIETIMAIRNGIAEVTFHREVLKAEVTEVSETSAIPVCPTYGSHPTEDQALYALIKYGPTSGFGFGTADHLWVHDDMERDEVFRLMAREYVDFDFQTKRKRKNKFSETMRITRKAINDWREEIFGDEEDC